MCKSATSSGGGVPVVEATDGEETRENDGVIDIELALPYVASTIAASADGCETVRVLMKKRKTTISALEDRSLTTSLTQLTPHFYSPVKQVGDLCARSVNDLSVTRKLDTLRQMKSPRPEPV